MKLSSIHRCVIFCILCLLLTSCDQIVGKHRQEVLEQAEAAEKRGDFVEALNFYEASLDGTPDSADQHFQMALLCESKVNDPVGALFHFRRCERLAPEGRHAKEARASRQRLEPAVLAFLSSGSTLLKSDAVALKNENITLRNLINQLKEQVKTQAQTARQQRRESAAGTKPGKPEPLDPALIQKMGGRTYIVEPGDTLEIISRKVYKSKGRTQDIADANFNNLPDPKKLQVGQVLILPQ